MNAQDWLAYFQQQEAQNKKRKGDWLDWAGTGLGAGAGFLVGGPPGALAGASLGRSVGDAGENAINGTLTPGNLIADATGVVSGYKGLTDAMNVAAGKSLMEKLVAQGFPMGFAGGGMVPDLTNPLFQQAAFGPPQQPQQPQMPVIRSAADVKALMDGIEAGMAAMPGGSFTPEQPKHPTLEMLASVIPDVVKSLPAPRQTKSVNKTIGAWAPAAATAFSAPVNYLKAQREERNKRGREAAKALAEHRWGFAKSLTDSLDTQRMAGMTNEPMTPQQYEALGVPAEYRTPAGYKAWIANRARGDQNVGRLTLAARTNKDISQFPDVRDSYARIAESASGGGKTGLSDMALVFSFMKVLDPTSVVREGEYERAVKTAGIPAWVWSAYQRASTGKFLHPDQRADMVRLAKAYYDKKVTAYRNARAWLNKLAQHYNVDPSLAIPNLELSGTQLAPIDPTMPDNPPPDNTQVDEHGVPIPGILKPVVGGGS